MKLHHLVTGLATGLATALLVGCSSTGNINSLDDLTAQVDVEGLFTLPQQRLLSLSGLMPEGPPGALYRYDKARSPFTAVGISQLYAGEGEEGAPARETKRLSYFLVRKTPFAVPEGDGRSDMQYLLDLRDTLLEVRRLAAEAIRIRLERSAYARRAFTEDDRATDAELQDEVQAAQAAFTDAWKEASTMVTASGLMVIRTNTKKTISLAARIGSFLGLNAAEDQETAGFAILAGLETSMLYVGNDLDDWLSPLGRDWSLIGSRFPYVFGLSSSFPWVLGQFSHYDVQVVTSKLSADYVLYASDQLTERSVQAEIETTVKELSSSSSFLSESDEISIEGILTAVESLGNIGVLGPVEQHEVLAGDIEPPPLSNRTVYEVLTDYDDLARLARSGARWHFSRWF